MASVGLNKDYQFSPYGQRGGLNAFPSAGVISGFDLSLAGTDNDGINAVTNTTASITIAAGKARYNGKLVTLASPLTANLATGVNLTTASNFKIKVFMNPPRLTSVYLTGASQPTVVNGGYTIQVRPVNGLSYGTYYIAEEIYIGKYNALIDSDAWVAIDPFSELPDNSDYNGLPFNDVGSAIVAANISLENEVPIFLGTALPPHVATSSNAMLRQSAGILLGEVTYNGGTGVITKTLPDYHLLAV